MCVFLLLWGLNQNRTEQGWVLPSWNIIKDGFFMVTFWYMWRRDCSVTAPQQKKKNWKTDSLFTLLLLQELRISRYRWLTDLGYYHCFYNKLPCIHSVKVSRVCQSPVNLCVWLLHKHSSGLKNGPSCDDDYSCHGDRIWRLWAAATVHLTN